MMLLPCPYASHDLVASHWQKRNTCPQPPTYLTQRDRETDLRSDQMEWRTHNSISTESERECPAGAADLRYLCLSCMSPAAQTCTGQEGRLCWGICTHLKLRTITFQQTGWMNEQAEHSSCQVNHEIFELHIEIAHIFNTSHSSELSHSVCGRCISTLSWEASINSQCTNYSVFIWLNWYMLDLPGDWLLRGGAGVTGRKMSWGI